MHVTHLHVFWSLHLSKPPTYLLHTLSGSHARFFVCVNARLSRFLSGIVGR